MMADTWDARPLYAAHSTDHTFILLVMCCWLFGSKVVASLLGTMFYCQSFQVPVPIFDLGGHPGDYVKHSLISLLLTGICYLIVIYGAFAEIRNHSELAGQGKTLQIVY